MSASTINNAITSAPPDTVVRIPSGTYSISGSVNLKSNVTLRGAGASYPWLPGSQTGNTVLTFSSGRLNISGGSPTWTPSAPGGTAITSGYTKGSTALTVSSASGYSVGNIILILQDNDSSVMNISQECGWCPDGQEHMLGQYAKITAIDTTIPGAHVITIDHGLHYVSPSAANPMLRRQTNNITMAGIENLKLQRSAENNDIIYMCSADHCWVKNVETYKCGSSSANAHIDICASYACEIRDNYCHSSLTGASNNTSGANYGIWLEGWWCSDIKIENNIVRDTRHAINFEMAGVGCAVLYNFTMDNWEDDTSYLSADLNLNHGPHPCMNLVEGNYCTNIMLDYTFGSSGYFTLLRNYARGKRDAPTGYTQGVWAINIEKWSRYANLVGNVIGESSWTTGTVLAETSGEYNLGTPSSPVAFRFGFLPGGNSGWEDGVSDLSYSTAILHGNYDFITDGVAIWASDDHAFANSHYYGSKPSFFGSCSWPPIGLDVTGNYSQYFWDLPALARYEGRDPYPSETLTKSKSESVRLKESVTVERYPLDITKSLSSKLRLKEYINIERGEASQGQTLQVGKKRVVIG